MHVNEADAQWSWTHASFGVKKVTKSSTEVPSMKPGIMMQSARSAMVCFCLIFSVSISAQQSTRTPRQIYGPEISAQANVVQPALRHPLPGANLRSWVVHWNELAINASALDHTPVPQGESRAFGEQVGPARTARALAIVHIAMFDALNAIQGGFRSYTGIPPGPSTASTRIAIIQAAHDTLVSLYPSQAQAFDARYTESYNRSNESQAVKDAGAAVGRAAAAAILNARSSDGSQHLDPLVGVGYIPGTGPGDWRPDPIANQPVALGAFWSQVRPFAIQAASQFRVPGPPGLSNPLYTQAFDEVNRLGGDGITTPTQRDAEETEIGIYWGYDGTPGVGVPPRMHNQIAVQIALQRNSNATQTMRLLALVNVALADAALAAWESKYAYEFWRPVGGIREADTDGNPNTTPDPNYTPLGAPSSNFDGPNFTPPFPAYPSGHATFGGALFQMLRRFYGTNSISFTFVSDEFNGVTRDNLGNVRPLTPRTFSSLSQADDENAQSRIYLGIHWAFDATEGQTQGERVADYVFPRVFTPVN
jgi:hypothetical protein